MMMELFSLLGLALKELEDYTQGLDCDHSVGVCMCGTKSVMEEIKRTINRAPDWSPLILPQALPVPRMCQRCNREPHAGLHLFHPSEGACMGKDDGNFTPARWLAACFICLNCRWVIARRTREGKVDRFLRRVRVTFHRIAPPA